MALPHPGKWSPVFVPVPAGQQPSVVLNTQQIAAHACVICTDLQTQNWKVLYGYPTNREGEPPNDKVRTRIWDPATNTIDFQNIPDWPSGGIPADRPTIFCGGHTYMSDGRILWAGGMRLGAGQLVAPHFPGTDIFGNNYTYIFDPNIFNPNPPEWQVAGGEQNPHTMAEDRYYPTLIHLGEIPPNTINGEIIVMSGWIDYPTQNRIPEYYDETSGWIPYSSAAEQPFYATHDYYPSGHIIPSGPRAGHIFYSIPMEQAYVFNPFADGLSNPYWSTIGQPRTNRYRLNGTSTLLPLLPPYDKAKVLITGGAPDQDQTTYSYNSAEVIDIAQVNPQWSLINDFLFFARKNHLSVILPNDMLFIVGGNLRSYGLDPVFSAELVDTTQTDLSSSMMPAHVYPREHHCISLLLPDATVLLSGSGELETEDVETVKYMEIYEPGYLFEGERPVILSPLTEITYGSDFPIQTSLPIEASPNGIRLIRLSAVTHSTDMSQLSVGLSHEQVSPNNYTVKMPLELNKNVAPPGLYMLFVLRPKGESLSQQTMIPSVAKIVMLMTS